MMRRFVAGLACIAVAMPGAGQQETVIIQIHGSETRIVEHLLRIEQDDVSRSKGTDTRIDQMTMMLRRIEERDARPEGHAGLRPRKAGITSAWRTAGDGQASGLVERGLEQLEQANYDDAEVALREHEVAANARFQAERSESSRLHWIEALALLAEVSYHRGDYPNALERYRTAAAQLSAANSSSSDEVLAIYTKVMEGLACAYAELGQREPAIAQFERATQVLTAAAPRVTVQRMAASAFTVASSWHEGWGNDDKALTARRDALATLRKVLGSSRERRDYLDASRTAAYLAKLEHKRGNQAAAEHALSEANALYRKTEGAEATVQPLNLLWKMHERSDSVLEGRRNALATLAAVSYKLGRVDEAERAFSEALRMSRQVPGDAGLAQGITADTSELLLQYGEFQLDTGRFGQALATFEQAIPITESLVDAMPQDLDLRFALAEVLNGKAEALVALGRRAEAIQTYVQLEAAARKYPGPYLLKAGENLMRMIALRSLAELKDVGESAGEITRLLDEAAHLGRIYVAAAPKEDAVGKIYLTGILQRQCLYAIGIDGDAVRARASLSEARELIGKADEVPLQFRDAIELAFARAYSALGQFEDADRSFETALRHATLAQSGPDRGTAASDGDAVVVLLQWARSISQSGKEEAALAKYAEAETLAKKEASVDAAGTAASLLPAILFEQISTLRRLGQKEPTLRKAEALEILTRSRPGITGAAAGINDDRLDALGEIGDAYEGLGRYAEALETYRRAVDIARTYIAASTTDNRKGYLHLALALTYSAQVRQRDRDDTGALPLLQEAFALAPRMDEEDRWSATDAGAKLATAFDRLGRTREADTARIETLRLAQQLPGRDGLARGENLHAANAHFQLALAAERKENAALAAEQFGLAAETAQKFAKKIKLTSFNKVHFSFALIGQARALKALDRYEDAVKKLEEADEAARSAEPGDYFEAVLALAPDLFALGKRGRAAALLERALDIAEGLRGTGTLPAGTNIHTLKLLIETVKLSNATRDNASAAKASLRAVTVGEALLSSAPDDSQIRWLTTDALIYAAETQSRDDRLQPAETHYRRALDVSRRLASPTGVHHPLHWRAQLGLSETLFRLNRRRDARTAAEEALKMALLMPGAHQRAAAGINNEALETYRTLAEQAGEEFDTRAASAHYVNALKVARSLQALYPQAAWLADTIADLDDAQARLRRGGFGAGQ